MVVVVVVTVVVVVEIVVVVVVVVPPPVPVVELAPPPVPVVELVWPPLPVVELVWPPLPVVELVWPPLPVVELVWLPLPVVELVPVDIEEPPPGDPHATQAKTDAVTPKTTFVLLMRTSRGPDDESSPEVRSRIPHRDPQGVELRASDGAGRVAWRFLMQGACQVSIGPEQA
jgi:hypothetical protein